MMPTVLAMMLTLTNECGTARIDTQGALVDSYVPRGGEEVFFRQSGVRRTNDWYNGGVPVCWPWFDQEGEPGTDIHGFARLKDWKVESCENGCRESRAVLSLEEARHYRLEYEVTLADSLTLKLKMKNTGTERFVVTTCLHPYFLVSDPANVTIATPEGKMVRGRGGMDGPQALSSGVYEIHDAGSGRRLSLEMFGNNAAVVWNIGPEETLPGLAPGDWKRYICVEPAVMPRARGFYLCPGEVRQIGMSCRLRASQSRVGR